MLLNWVLYRFDSVVEVVFNVLSDWLIIMRNIEQIQIIFVLLKLFAVVTIVKV